MLYQIAFKSQELPARTGFPAI